MYKYSNFMGTKGDLRANKWLIDFKGLSTLMDVWRSKRSSTLNTYFKEKLVYGGI